MRLWTMMLAGAALLASCQRHELPPSKPKLFESRTGLLSTDEIDFLQEQTSDASPEDVKYYEDPENWRLRDEIQHRLLNARSCVAKFRVADARRDAATSARSGDLRLYLVTIHDPASDLALAGFPDCRFNRRAIDRDFRLLHNPNPMAEPIVRECHELMSAYGQAYNMALRDVAPDAVAKACRSKRARSEIG